MVTKVKPRGAHLMVNVCLGMHVQQSRGRQRGVDTVESSIGVVHSVVDRAVGEIGLMDLGEVVDD